MASRRHAPRPLSGSRSSAPAPPGFYAAEHLLKQEDVAVEVDMFDRLPTPFGLVRAGVAPDHPKIKSVIRVYEKTAAREGFRFFGNVHVGEDVTLDDLREHYHAVICAYGTSTDRSLGIDGEDLPGSHAATEFVAWYNAHPDFADRVFDLSTHRVVVIGNGNVAADVARMLALTREELEETDTADHAIDALAESGVEEIVVLGRRGPAQAAFTNPEVRELGEMLDADIVDRPGRRRARRSQPELIESGRGRADQQAERRDLHGLRRARARGQAQADHPALPRLARRDQGRRQGPVDRRRARTSSKRARTARFAPSTPASARRSRPASSCARSATRARASRACRSTSGAASSRTSAGA